MSVELILRYYLLSINSSNNLIICAYIFNTNNIVINFRRLSKIQLIYQTFIISSHTFFRFSFVIRKSAAMTVEVAMSKYSSFILVANRLSQERVRRIVMINYILYFLSLYQYYRLLPYQNHWKLCNIDWQYGSVAY